MRQPTDHPRAWRTICFAIATLVAACTGGCGANVSPEHTAAIAKIQGLGGDVNYKRGGYEVVWSGEAITNDDLAHLKNISNLKSLDLRGTRITDEGLVHVETISTLEFVNLQRTGVTAEAADRLRKKLPNTDVRR
jgi:hypothetical protein